MILVLFNETSWEWIERIVIYLISLLENVISIVWHIYSTTFTSSSINQIKMCGRYVSVRNPEKAGINITYDAGHNSLIFEV